MEELRPEGKSMADMARVLNAEGFHPPKRVERVTGGMVAGFLARKYARGGEDQGLRVVKALQPGRLHDRLVEQVEARPQPLAEGGLTLPAERAPRVEGLDLEPRKQGTRRRLTSLARTEDRGYLPPIQRTL